MLLCQIAILASLVYSACIVTAFPFLSSYGSGPVIQTDFPDPSIIEVNGTWYAFSTSANVTGPNIQVASSNDSVVWEVLVIANPLPDIGGWTAAADHNVWAPDVVQLDDQSFVMYYAASSSVNTSLRCIGAATSEFILGPYIPRQEPLACPLLFGGAIDPDGFQDPATKTQYLLYKVDGNSLEGDGPCGNDGSERSTPIMLQMIEDDGVHLIGDPVQILDRGPYDGPLIEAPTMFLSSNGTYFLLFSSNCYETLYYDISYATATSINGTYHKATQPLLVTADTVANIQAPGSADVSIDGDRIVFHGTVGQINPPLTRPMYEAHITTIGQQLVLGNFF